MNDKSQAAPQQEPVALTDEKIVQVLHSLGIDTYPSKYGFSALQVSATSVPNLRKVIEAFLAASHPQAAQPSDESVPMCESCDDPATVNPDGSTAPCPACVEFYTEPVAAQPQEAGQADWIGDVISYVAELPDRSSPEDWPEAMLVTGDELRGIIEDCAPHFAAPSAPAVPDGFSRDDLLDVAEALEADHEQTINVGPAIEPDHDVLLDSEEAYAARFIRAVLAAAPSAPAGEKR